MTMPRVVVGAIWDVVSFWMWLAGRNSIRAPKGTRLDAKICLIALEISSRHKVSVLVVSLLYVLHLSASFTAHGQHSRHASLVEESASSSFDNANMRLDGPIALWIMWLAAIVLLS